MQCEYYALEGISALLDTIDALKARLNPQLEIEGVLRTMFDVRNNLANAVSAELTNHFGDRVFRTIVPRNVRLAEAPSHGQSIVGYDRASRGGIAYLGLAGEVLRRQREREQAAKQRREGESWHEHCARSAASAADWKRCSAPRPPPKRRRWKPRPATCCARCPSMR